MPDDGFPGIANLGVKKALPNKLSSLHCQLRAWRWLISVVDKLDIPVGLSESHSFF